MNMLRTTYLTGVTIGLALVALAGCRKPKTLATVAGMPPSPTATKGTGTLGNAGSPRSGKAKYVPRVSEKKFEEFLMGRTPAEIAELTDEQVYAIMGEPTRRDAAVTAQKNGQTFTVYKAYWEEPGSGIQSVIGFSNGRCAGMIIGVEFTPKGSKDTKKGTP